MKGLSGMIFLAACLCLNSCQDSLRQVQKPNIILILADDLEAFLKDRSGNRHPAYFVYIEKVN